MTSCSVTPISNNEYKGCNFRIYAGDGFIEVKAAKEMAIEIYSINGNKVMQTIIKEGKVSLKKGVYIVKIGNERLRLVVR